MDIRLNEQVDDAMNLKLADFGLSKIEDNEGTMLTKLKSSYAYTAPEVYFGELYSSQSDVFSLSIIIWEMLVKCLTGSYQRPYDDFHVSGVEFQIIIQTAKKNLRPTIPDSCPEPLREFLNHCWHGDAKVRFDSERALADLRGLMAEYLANSADWDKLLKKSPVGADKNEDLSKTLPQSFAQLPPPVLVPTINEKPEEPKEEPKRVRAKTSIPLGANLFRSESMPFKAVTPRNTITQVQHSEASVAGSSSSSSSVPNQQSGDQSLQWKRFGEGDKKDKKKKGFLGKIFK